MSGTFGVVSRSIPGCQSQDGHNAFAQMRGSSREGWQDMCDKSLSDGYFDVLILTALLSGSRIAISLVTLSISLGTHFRIPGGRSPHVGCSSVVA